MLVYNELTALIVSFLMIVYTSDTYRTEIKHTVATICIILIFTHVIVNFVISLVSLFQ